MKSKLWFVTFADTRLTRVRKRLLRQTRAIRAFDGGVFVFSEKDLSVDFLQNMGNRVRQGVKGFGYWCWKPQVIFQVMANMPDNDVLLYVDAGCHINKRGRKRLEYYKSLAEECGIVAFQARSMDETLACANDSPAHFWKEYQWTKKALLNYFSVEHNKDIVTTGQLVGNAMLFCKNEKTMNFVKTWRDLFWNHFELCDDTPSAGGESSGFIEHRYDQSAFSVLAKLFGAKTLSCAELFPIRWAMPTGSSEDFWNDGWNSLSHNPIQSRRDKGELVNLLPGWIRSVGRFVCSLHVQRM